MHRDAVEVFPPQGTSPSVIQDLRALAARYPGDWYLRLVVMPGGHRRVLTYGEEVDGASLELVQALRRYGDVVLVRGGNGGGPQFWRFNGERC